MSMKNRLDRLSERFPPIPGPRPMTAAELSRAVKILWELARLKQYMKQYTSPSAHIERLCDDSIVAEVVAMVRRAKHKHAISGEVVP